MNNSKTNNDGSSATTSRNAQSAGNAETDFLARQSEDAKNAISDVLKVIQNDLKGAADVRAWAQQYPWYTVGAAAVAGFATASVVVPRRGVSLEEKVAALIPESIREQAEAENAAEQEQRAGIGSSGIFGSLMGTVMEAVKTTLQSAVVAAVTTKAVETNDENNDGSNGEYDQSPADSEHESVA